MSKTYNLTATLNTGYTPSTIDGNWSTYSSDSLPDAYFGRVGRESGPAYYATNMVFDSATLNTLRNKTINGVTLTLVITQGMDAPALVAWKYNSTSSGNGNSGAWARSNNAGTITAGEASIATTANPSFAEGEVTTGTKTLTLNGLPQYGFVAGPYNLSRNGIWKISSATLNVTTNETDYNYTLAYNANGGSGAPSNQTGSNTGTSPYYTFTVSSTVPTKAGHTFLGWSTSSSATSATYTGGGSITVTSSGTTTLYAVWKVNTYTVSYNANGGTGAPPAQTKTYNVSLPLSSTVPTRSGYIFQGWATSSTGAVAYQPSGSYTANASVTLYAIWKAANSTLSSVDDTNIESRGTASWNKIDNSYTYKLVLTYSNAPAVTVNVAANNASTSFSIPTTWYAYLPNSTSATATATLTTYSGSTALGTSTKTFTVSVASSIKPSISSFTHTPYSQNNTVNGWGVYVQGYSQVDLAVSAVAGTGAEIISYSFSGAGVSKTGTHPAARSLILDNTEYVTYTVVVTDSRGRRAEYTLSGNNRPYFYAYSSPVVASLTTYRSNSSGVRSDIDGTYIHSIPSFTYSAVGNNSLTVKKIEYKLHTASSWSTGVSSATSGAEYTFGGGIIDITKSYDVRCTVTDSLNNTGVLSVLVPPVVGFSIGLNNDRARFGGPVEKAGLQVDWTVDVTPRRCSATLDDVSWYRVLTYSATSAAEGLGNFGRIFDFNITRSFSNSSNEVHKVSLLNPYNKFSFANEQSASNTQLISAIRVMQDNSGNTHIDIRYTGTSDNLVTVWFDMYTRPDYLYRCVAVNLSPVVDSPQNETELSRYGFIANTGSSITLTPSNCNANDTCWYARIGNVCYLHIDVKDLTPRTITSIFTLPDGFRPISGARLKGSGQESWLADALADMSTARVIRVYSEDHYAIIDGNFICAT